jgi:PAS domain S-box-containing protein
MEKLINKLKLKNKRQNILLSVGITPLLFSEIKNSGLFGLDFIILLAICILTVTGLLIKIWKLRKHNIAQNETDDFLHKTENYAEDILESISDAFVALDKNYVYTYVNKNAALILNKKFGELEGKHMWSVFPESEGNIFYDSVIKAVKEQKMIQFDDYAPKFDRWLETRIYPSKKGISIFFRDITKRKSSEKKIEEQLSTIKGIIESSESSIFSVDLKYCYTSFNSVHAATMHNIYGVDIESGHSILDYMSNEEDKLKAKKNLDRALNGETFTEEAFSGDEKLSRFYFDIIHNPIRNNDDKVIGVAVFSFEITKKKQSEELIRLNELRLNYSLEAASLGSWEINIATGKIWRSLKHDQIFGYDRALPEWSFDLFLEHILPEERRGVQEQFQDVLANGTEWSFECRIRRADGVIRWIWEKGSPEVNDNNKSITLFGIVQDITNRKQVEAALKESEEKFHVLVENAADAFYLFNLEGKFLEVNDQACETLGYSRAELLIMGVADIEQNLVISDARKAWNEIQIGEPVTRRGYQKRKDGKEFPVEIRLVCLIFKGERLFIALVRDITERKHSEDLLKESEKRYRYLFENNPQTMWIYDLETLKFLEVNNTAIKNYGYSREEFLSMTIKDIRPPEDVPLLMENVASTVNPFSESGVWRHLDKSGNLIYVEIISHIVTFNNREARLVMTNNVTKKVLAERELAESEEKYRSIYENSSVAILFLSTEGRILSANQEACLMFERTEEEMLLNNIDKFLDIEDPRLPALVEERKLTGKIKGELKFIRKDGSRFAGELSSIIVKDNDNSERISMVIRDLTEQKQAEEMLRKSEETYRTIFEYSPLAAVFWDRSAKILFWNKTASDVFGWSGKEMIGKKITDFLVLGQTQENYKDNIDSLIKAMPQSATLVENTRKDGVVILCEWNNTIIYDKFNNPSTIISIGKDVTEQKRMEKDILESREELRELAAHLQTIREEERTAIAREMHDDLGQLLTSIKMNLSLLSREIGVKDSKITIPEIDEEIKSMAGLIDRSVKGLRKLITELRPEVLDNLGIIQSLEWVTQEFQEKTKISCKFVTDVTELDLKKDYALAVFRITQEALTNIARHAKATDVKVNLNYQEDVLKLEIKDNGIGFNPEKLKNRNSFGLIGIKERIVLLGGSFDIWGQVGQGTKISISIPLKK